MMRIPIGLVLVCLLSACNTGSENQYDIPAGQAILQANLEIEPDGTPLIFAEVGMDYATAAPLQEWEPRILQRNSQAIAYTPGTGGWASHSFRNMEGESGGPSYFLRNFGGGIQALLQGLHRRILYAQKGTEWEVKKSIPDKVGSDAEPNFNMWHGDPIVLAGDTAWEMPEELSTNNTGDTRFYIRLSNGTHFELDTAFQYGETLLLPGKESNYLILSYQPNNNSYPPGNGDPSRPENTDPTIGQKLICYRWSLDPSKPNPRKQVLQLDHPATYGSFSYAQVLGETRVYYQLGPDSLAEFGLRNDTLALLGYRVFPGTIDSTGGYPFKRYQGGNFNVDPIGCIHSMVAGRPIDTTEADSAYFLNRYSVLVHASSCEGTPDTIPVPRPASGIFQFQISELRFDPEGNPMVALMLQTSVNANDYGSQQGIPPSWLYFARRSAGRKWTWEKVAQY
ncbi:MAG: hypothetical protein JF616_03305 [Fibrobacteres bacterium]|nr:hypothetical protein [Fibrobacterota bacterium]